MKTQSAVMRAFVRHDGEARQQNILLHQEQI